MYYIHNARNEPWQIVYHVIGDNVIDSRDNLPGFCNVKKPNLVQI